MVSRMEYERYTVIVDNNDNVDIYNEIEKYFNLNGVGVVFCNSHGQKNIYDKVSSLFEVYNNVDSLIYFNTSPKSGSLTTSESENALKFGLNNDLEDGLWWIQSVCKKFIEHNTKGRILTVGHITSVVPTERYSYGACGQQALMNLCRSAILDLKPHNININTVLCGFDESNSEEYEFIESMKQLHKDDGIPLLEYTSSSDLAKTCYLLTDISVNSFNGSLITLDSGFYVTRKIRYIEDKK